MGCIFCTSSATPVVPLCIDPSDVPKSPESQVSVAIPSTSPVSALVLPVALLRPGRLSPSPSPRLGLDLPTDSALAMQPLSSLPWTQSEGTLTKSMKELEAEMADAEDDTSISSSASLYKWGVPLVPPTGVPLSSVGSPRLEPQLSSPRPPK
eukprot:EG_transcript_20819